MASRMWETACLLVVVVVAGTSLSGCANAPGTTTTVSGVAVADHPIDGATVSVVSATGETLAKKQGATGPQGDFAIDVAELPESYTVVVTGGTRDGHPLDGDLKASVSSADSTDGVNVSPVSSLAAEYAAANPGIAPDQALSKVKSALGIPAETDTRSPMSSTEPAFDSVRYMAAATHSGGLDNHEAALVARLDGVSPGSLAFGDSVSDDVLMEAVKGAAGAAGEQAAGWVLRKAGMSGEPDGFDDIKRQLDQVQSELQALSQEIQKVHLAQLTAEIQHRDETVRAGTIQVSECATTAADPGTISAAKDNGMSLRAQAEAQPFGSVLTDNIVTNQSGGGLLHEYRSAQMAKPYWTQADVDGIRGQFGYYRGLQSCEYLLVAEYLHATDRSAPSSDTASPAVAKTIGNLGDQYLSSLALQKAKYAPPASRLHPKVVYSTKGQLMVAYGMVARYDDRHYAPEAKGIRRSDSKFNPGVAVAHFNKQGGGPGGHKDWRLPTKDEIKTIFSGKDFDPYYATSSGEPNHLPNGRIIWTSEWKKGWAYDTKSKSFFDVCDTFDPDTKPDMYDGSDERFSPGPASILFVRTVNPATEGYWSTPLK